ncbi:MAG TPA: disulfide bond formation protein B [Stellaceae bacterium]|nr:disulfide bond formation protein B [Stellaceae bacterium]
MTTPRTALVLILLASVAIIAIVIGAQYIGGLQPCELCLDERWAYYAAIVVTLLGLVPRRNHARRAVLWLVALIFAAGSVLSAYHVGIEQHWIAGPTACTGGLGGASSPDQLLKLLQARQPVQCDVVQWSFLGISLAGFNLIASLVLLVFSLSAARRRGRR